MDSKDAALSEIVELARHSGLTAKEITAALKIANNESTGSNLVSRLLAYVGGIFVFAGLSVFITMFWANMNTAAHIIITLGSGLVALVLAVQILNHNKWSQAATPLFLISAALQPTGILVAFHDLGNGGDARIAILIMSLVLLIQQILVFRHYQKAVLLFTSLFFGSSFFFSAFDLMDMDGTLTALVMGLSLLLVTFRISKTPYYSITPLWYFIGSAIFLWSAFDLIEGSPVEVLYLAVTGFMIYVSTLVKSRTLLFVSTVSMISYIGYFSAEYFVDSVGWPVALIVMGLVLIGLSNMALRINKKYIQGHG